MNEIDYGYKRRKPVVRQTIVHCVTYKPGKPKKTGMALWKSEGTLYFLYCDFLNVMKIGFTRRPPRDRLKEIQGGCPYDIRIAALCRALPAEEEAMHKRFAHLWIRGEWFRYEGDLADHVDTLNLDSPL